MDAVEEKLYMLRGYGEDAEKKQSLRIDAISVQGDGRKEGILGRGHGKVQIMDAGNAGCAHVRAMVPCVGLGIICPEEVADSLSTNKNPRARNKREKKRCPWT